ncbi:DUF2262 domain-containing protein [Actinoplanes philippinensis]|uniref:DUF2262 domain-containing protein n=1 Tax=Actinoplanes philippinensis TaxID=35752 RepID=UPI0033EE3757
MAISTVHTALGELRRSDGGFDFSGRLGEVAIVLDVDDAETAVAVAQRVSTTIGDLDDFARRVATQLAYVFAPEGPDEVEVWENGESIVSGAEFARRLTLGCVTAASDGDVEVYFDDDEMFGGHTIRAWIDESGTVTDAQIAG